VWIDSAFIIAAVITPFVPAGDRQFRTDSNRVRTQFVYRWIREIFVPSMLTPHQSLLTENKRVGIILQRGCRKILCDSFVHHNNSRTDANFPTLRLST